MIKGSRYLLILLLPVLSYSISLDFDVTLIEKIIFLGTESLQYYCVNKKSEIEDLIIPFSNIYPSIGCRSLGDIHITIKTKNEDYRYIISKDANDPLINHYVDLANNKPNWFQFKIVSNRFDLIDTTLNYLRTNYYVEPLDKIKLISHRFKIESKELIPVGDTNKFIELTNNINKNYHTISHSPLYYGMRQYSSIIQAIHIMEFYFKDIFTLTEAMRHVDSVKWVKIKDVEIKNDYEIRFWVEMVSPNKKKIKKMTKRMKDSGIEIEILETVYHKRIL